MKAEISTDNVFLLNQDTGEQINLKGVKTISTEELEHESPIDDIKTGMKLLSGNTHNHVVFADCTIVFDALIQVTDKTSEILKKLAEVLELEDVRIDETKEIVMLEERKKHCKNYLELKQINRRLNVLKFGKRKGKLHES